MFGLENYLPIVFLSVSFILLFASAYLFIEDEWFFSILCMIFSLICIVFCGGCSIEREVSYCEQITIETISEIETILETDSVEEYDVNVKYDNGTYTITIKE